MPSYAARNPDWHAKDSPFKARAVHDTLARLGWRPRAVLDYGCGTGDVLRWLRDHDDGQRTYTGYDPDPYPLAARPPGPRITLSPDDPAHAHPRFDVGLMLDVFEHVPDDIELIQRALPAAPRWIFRIPLDLSVLDVLRPERLLAARHRYGHRHAYTRHTAIATVRDAGLTVVDQRLHRIPLVDPTPRQRATQSVRALLARSHPTLAADLLGGWSLIVAAEG